MKVGKLYSIGTSNFFEEKKKNLLEFSDECFVMKSNIKLPFA